MTLEQRPEGGDSVSSVNIWGQNISERGNSQCKGPVVGGASMFQVQKGQWVWDREGEERIIKEQVRRMMKNYVTQGLSKYFLNRSKRIS